jgi:hypothetical protein
LEATEFLEVFLRNRVKPSLLALHLRKVCLLREKSVRVAVCFQDIEIAEVFAELVACMGAQAEVVEDLASIDRAELSKVVTEPMYFQDLPERLQQSCLLVGNKEVLSRFSTPTLSRPLTEEKVTNALGDFLGA